MELGRNARHVGIAGTAVKGVFSSRRMGNRIPINLRFVFTIRGVPHDFGTIAKHVTDGNVGNLGTFNRVEGGKAKRCLGTIDHVLERNVFWIIGICACRIEVVSGAVLKSAQDNFMLHARHIVFGDHRFVHCIFASTVIKAHRTTSRKLNHHNGRVHAYVANFHTHTRSYRAVKLGCSKHARTYESCSGIDTGFRLMIVFPAFIVRNH